MRELLSHRYAKWGGILALLILANIVNSIYWNWGLITVKVTDAPLSKVIKSIEWQGWVTIYTNLPMDTKVSMTVDHVPLAEAMESLAANASGPPPADRPDRQNDGAPGAPRPDGMAGGTPGGPRGSGGGGDRRQFGGNRPDGGGPGGPGGGRGRGGFGGGGGGTQWNLAFFVAPTSAQVKTEIRAFQSGTTDDDMKIYNFPTSLQMIASDDEMPAADPRLQTWPGYKPPAPPPPPVAPAGADPSAAAPADTTPTTPTTQTYLRGFAQSANIWIMAPGSWDPAVSSEPPSNTSIISAVKNFVGRVNGSVTSAIILRSGRGGRGGGGGPRGGGFADMDSAADRIRNAINGLPEEARAGALNQLDQEVKFFQDVKLAPPEQQMQMVRDHFRNKMDNNNWRRSPENRAKMYQRAVSNRQTAQGKK